MQSARQMASAFYIERIFYAQSSYYIRIVFLDMLHLSNIFCITTPRKRHEYHTTSHVNCDTEWINATPGWNYTVSIAPWTWHKCKEHDKTHFNVCGRLHTWHNARVDVLFRLLQSCNWRKLRPSVQCRQKIFRERRLHIHQSWGRSRNGRQCAR